MEKKNKFAALLWLPLVAITYWRIPQVPPDFALKLSGIFYDGIDTFNGEYSRPAVRRPDKMSLTGGEVMKGIIVGDSTVPYSLNQDEKREIYLLLQQMNYAYYPDNSSAKCENQIVSSHKVELIIRANRVIKHVSYEDGCEDETTQSSALKRLVSMLYEISNRHKVVQDLPETALIGDM